MRYTKVKILLSAFLITIATYAVIFTKIRMFDYIDYDGDYNETSIKRNDDDDLFRYKYQRVPYNVDCELILESNKNEIERAERYLDRNVYNKSIPIPDHNYIFPMDQCSQFRRLRGYDDHPVSTIELDFPLAFIILTYKDIEQFERLLRVIYRPHNVYCIHTDAKSPPEFHNAIKSIVQCFDNVFIASKLERIVYAGYSRLQADFNCMSDLLDANYARIDPTKKQVKWKYLFNLASTEFPLKTNYEIVRIMQQYNGGNDIETIEKYDPLRMFWKFVEEDGKLKMTNMTRGKPPHGFTLVKGLAYGGFSYQFVEYVLNNKYAKDLAKWMEETYSPDEAFYATLQHNTQFNPPGGYKDSWQERPRVNTTSRFVSWGNDIYGCQGKWVRYICIFSFRDLPLLITRHELFVNKFHLDYNPIVYQCMEEWIEKKVKARPTVRVKDYCKHPVVSFYNKNFYCD